MPDRDFDVVVFGATGVTGRRVAAYLARRAPQTGARWAAAARNTTKLQAMLAEDGVAAPALIAADVGDPASLQAMAARTRVVLNLVGPYTLYGRPVIEACVAAGTHYADLTGEISFVRGIVSDTHALAEQAGVKIVQVCGFEALPPDLTVLLAAELARRSFGEALADVDLQVTMKPPPGLPRPSDGMSGGTLQSMAIITGSEGAGAITDPGLLVDDADRASAVRRVSPIGLAPRRTPAGTVIAPMAPAPFINPAIIHRTAWLLEPQGAPFRFREGIAMPGSAATLPLRYAAAGALSAVQVGVGALLRAGPGVRGKVSRGMSRVLPDSGFGPAADRLEGWGWRLTADATTTGGSALRVTLDADGHPGYLTTARMLGEAGLLLADPQATPQRFGCVTPAVALGSAGVARFEHAGMRFTTDPA